MGFKPALNITEQIADHLADEIIQGELAAHSRIQELRVARELGVSRGSVREALLILEGRKLIDIVPRKGAVVTELDATDIPEFAELFEDLERRIFERLLRAPKLDIAGLKAAVTALENAAREETVPDLLAARGAFYSVAIEQCGGQYLSTVLVSLVPSSQRLAYRVCLHPAFDVRDMARYYHALVDSLANRDRERMNELLHAYTARVTRLALDSGTGRHDVRHAQVSAAG